MIVLAGNLAGSAAAGHISPTLILLADGFAEGPVVESLCLLRTAGAPTFLTTLYAAWATGEHGLTVRADRRLSRLSDGDMPGLIILPGGLICIQTLLTSPLVYHFVRARQSALIIILREARLAALQTGLFNDINPLRLEWQAQQSLACLLQPYMRPLG